MGELQIDSEFQALIPPLSDEERATLESNLEAEGCRDPIVTWQGAILDGHNRYEICTRLGIAFQVEQMEFENRAEARVWMRNNQRGRRNLSDAWKIELELANKEDLAKIGQEVKVESGKEARKKQLEKVERGVLSETDNTPKSETTEKHNTRNQIAKDAGVSTGKVGQAEVVRKKDPELWEKAKQGDVTINAAYTKTRKNIRREEKAKAKSELPQDLPDLTDRWRILNCDLREADIERGSVDHIITDPPYPYEHIDTFSYLAEMACQWLKPGGSLAVMSGQSYLPEVMARLTAFPELQYNWTFSYLTPGGQAVQVWPRRVNTFWKPVIWLTKGDYKGDWVGDVVKSRANDNDKDHHHWGQSESGMADLLDRLTYPGELIVDPFCGGGTTGIVAIHKGRLFTGIDSEKASTDETKRRLSEVGDDPNMVA